MAPLSIQSSVEYAKNLLPETLIRSVSTVQTTISRHILPVPQPRPYKVCTHNRRRRRGLVASSLDDLLDKVSCAFLLTCQFLTLVLEEDGTMVEAEDFFQALPPNTHIMVLEKGEVWTQNKVLPSFRQPRRSGIAKLTFDLYKLNPKDFVGCLTIRATLYEIYTLSYDIRCTKAKDIFRCVLRCVTCMARVSGKLLLQGSTYILQLLGEDD
ncbi:lipid transferase CIDEA isoform X2 [Osmerus eperlanus]|uniref:lipid transferase CIDEA n=1 Tax=Osmerus mordax TaxID=8014 RepID=UPI002E117C6C